MKQLFILLACFALASCSKETSKEKKCGKVIFVTEFTATVAFKTDTVIISRQGLHGGDTYCK